jgi:hypothetical protein
MIISLVSEIERERERERDNYGTVDCGEGATRINGVDDT